LQVVCQLLHRERGREKVCVRVYVCVCVCERERERDSFSHARTQEAIRKASKHARNPCTRVSARARTHTHTVCMQVWRNCLYYSGDKDDATYMAREVGEEFDSLFADRILAPMMQQTRHTNYTALVPFVCLAVGMHTVSLHRSLTRARALSLPPSLTSSLCLSLSCSHARSLARSPMPSC